MEHLCQDLRYCIRMLTKNPGFTAIAVVTLALGIGANTAIFSVINAVVLRPLPFKDPDGLLAVFETDPQGYERHVSYATLADWKNQNQVFLQVESQARAIYTLTGVDEPEQLWGYQVSAGLFQLLGARPFLGRTFLAEEERPGGERLVVLSYQLWQRRFGSDPAVLGRRLTLDGAAYTVVGVMPQDFFLPDSQRPEFWLPLHLDVEQMRNRRYTFLAVFARLNPGVTLERAQAEMDIIAHRLKRQFPEDYSDVSGVTVTPLHEQAVRDVRLSLLVLLGAVGFVLLIACANVANLLLARAAARQKETAIRAALGASRLRRLQHSFTESLLLAALGCGVGLLLASWGIDFLVRVAPGRMVAGLRGPQILAVDKIGIDARVLVFTFSISLLTALVSGLVPALQASKSDLNQWLKEGGRISAGGVHGRRFRKILVVSEVALALVLLIGAALMMKSFLRLQQVDTGLNPDHVLTLRIPLSWDSTEQQKVAFCQQVLQRVQALPEVRSASVVSILPLNGITDSIGFSIEGLPLASPNMHRVLYRAVSPDYFQTMRISLLKGRYFTNRDTKRAPEVVIVNQAMARHFWPGEDPVRQRLTLDRATPVLCEVVGVVGDVKQNELGAEPRPEMYWPYVQSGLGFPGFVTLAVRTASDPLGLAGTLRREVWALNQDQPVTHIRTMEQVLSDSIAPQRFSMLLLAIFAAVALVLATGGVYGVMAYSVNQRTNEIGIRMALGAQQSDTLKLVIGEGMRLALIGVSIGLAGALALTRVMSSLLYGVSATDPATFVAISLLLASVVILACYIPARRAAKVDPMVALRYE